MRLLVLGRGKTGSLVADAARERGHAVSVLGGAENRDGSALTAGFLADFDAVIDFTTPEAVTANVKACVSAGARVVVGTTGWYEHLAAVSALAEERGASLVYGTNFSVGVQAFFRAARVLAESLPEYRFSIHETHHVAKKDAPSGTALTLKRIVEQGIASGAEIEVSSTREGDAAGLHVLTARSGDDLLTLQHEAFSRHGFAEGAVRAAEWIAQQGPGVWDFGDVAGLLN